MTIRNSQICCTEIPSDWKRALMTRAPLSRAPLHRRDRVNAITLFLWRRLGFPLSWRRGARGRQLTWIGEIIPPHTGWCWVVAIRRSSCWVAQRPKRQYNVHQNKQIHNDARRYLHQLCNVSCRDDCIERAHMNTHTHHKWSFQMSPGTCATGCRNSFYTLAKSSTSG